MKYWRRDEYFRKCSIEIQAISNKGGTKDYLEGLWKWIAQGMGYG
jgi:hypothetical protein